MNTQKGFASILIIIILAAAFLGGYFVYTNYSNNRTKLATSPTVQPTTQSSPSPTATSPTPTSNEETANWKTYIITNKLRFKYPSNYAISTNGEETVHIAKNKEKFTPLSEYITIDARLIGVYENYEEAVKVGTEKFINNPKYRIENFKDGIKVTWDLGDTLGKNKNSYSTLVYLKYNGGAITAQFNDDLDGLHTYDQIINTFEILD